MIKQQKITSRPLFIVLFRLFCIILLVVVIVLAAQSKTIAGLAPGVWVLIALASFMLVIFNTLLAIKEHLNNKDKQK